MPSKNTSIVSFTDAVVFLDKTTVSDSINVRSQIDISNGCWKITGDSSRLALEKKKQCVSHFSPTEGLIVKSIKTPTTILSNRYRRGLASIVNMQSEVHNSYGSPVSTHTSTTYDHYVVSISGYKYIKYTPTGLNNTNHMSIYRISPSHNNSNKFELLCDAIFTGVSNMNNSIIRGDYNFDTIFELLPFYTYAGQNDNVGILRIYSQTGGVLTFVQTLNDPSFNMTDFQVSADGNYILITSASEDSSFKIYKRNRESTVQWTLYHSGFVGSDSTFVENVIPIAIARNGYSFALRGTDEGSGCHAIMYSNTGDGFKYETELTRFNAVVSHTVGNFGSYSPDGHEFVIGDCDNRSTVIYEWLDGEWSEKQEISSTTIQCCVSYNGKFIRTVQGICGDSKWSVYARKHNGIYKLIAQYPAGSGSGSLSLIIDDRDVIHYIKYNGEGVSVLTSVYPIGCVLGGTTSTCDIGIATSVEKDVAINIGSETSAYVDMYTQNAVTVTSDRRLKKNISPITNCINLLNDMKPVSYTQRSDEYLHHGFSASNKPPIRYGEITSILAGALKEISNRIDNIV